MTDTDEIRKSIGKKLSKLGEGTFNTAMILNELEYAVHMSDMQRQQNLLYAKLCPNCTKDGHIVYLVRDKKHFWERGLLKCPECGFTLAGY